MKKLLSLAVLLVLSTIVFSQTSKDELKLAYEIFGMEKKAMVDNFVELPADNVFWTIYEEYETERKEFGDKRYNLLLEYAGNYVNYSDERLEKIMAESIKQRKAAEKVLQKYYKKVKKECGVKTASQFYFVQRFYDSTLRAHLLGQMPIVGN